MFPKKRGERVEGSWLNLFGWDVDTQAIENLAKPLIDNSLRKYTGSGLTAAEQEANAYTAQREDTRIQRTVADASAAGVNPLFAVSGNAVSPASSSVAPGSGQNLGDLLQVILAAKELPSRIQANKSASERNRAEGLAALEGAAAATKNADTAARNAETAARNASVQERLATVQEMRQQVDAALADSNIRINDAQLTYLARQCTILEKQYLQMDDILAIAQKNANSQEKQALASLQNAKAAIQNAATADYLSNYQSSLLYATELLRWAESDGQVIVNKYLDERQRNEVDNLVKLGIKLDAEGRLIDKQGNLVTAQTVKTYVNCATDVANSVSKFVGIGKLGEIGNKAASNLYKPGPGTDRLMDSYVGQYGPIIQ